MKKIDDLINDPDNIIQPYHEQTLQDMKEAVEHLKYAQEVFADTCDCGKCGPCQRRSEIEDLLEKFG